MSPAPGRTGGEVLAASSPSDWRALDPEHTVYLELPTGRVVIELAPEFAPAHVENITKLIQERFFDGLAVIRVQDNYVAQWGDADGKRVITTGAKTVPAEFTRAAKGLTGFFSLSDADTFAPEVGLVRGFPVARDPDRGRAWLVHCYGMVGAGRDDSPDSGGGAELYAVIGHAPRHLDRNVTLVGRVLQGIELLSSLPRGTGPLGFYERPEQHLPIVSARLASEIPEVNRAGLEVLRTDTPTYAAWVAARRSRTESWFVTPADRLDVCNATVPTRNAKKEGP